MDKTSAYQAKTTGIFNRFWLIHPYPCDRQTDAW